VAYTVVLMLYQNNGTINDGALNLAGYLRDMETVLVSLFILEFIMQQLAFGWKLYLKSQENVFDLIVLVLTVLGTVGTYLKYFQLQQERLGLTFDVEDYIPAAGMRALRLGRVSQLLRMLYKNKNMFDVMAMVLKGWKAIIGVVVFSAFSLCMFAIIAMHVLGGGLGPGRNECRSNYVDGNYGAGTLELAITNERDCEFKEFTWLPAVDLEDYPRSNFETFTSALRKRSPPVLQSAFGCHIINVLSMQCS